MKPSTVIFVVDLPTGLLATASDQLATQYAQFIKLAVMKVLYSTLDASGEWGFKFFDSTESAHGGSASKSEHVHPLDSNSIDVFTAALRENIRQKRLKEVTMHKTTATRSFVQRIVSAIGHIFVDFHLSPAHMLASSATAKTLIALIAPCPHSLSDLYSSITSESDFSHHISADNPGRLGRDDILLVAKKKLQKSFDSLGEKLLSVQAQLMWLDILGTVSEMNSGSFPFAPFDPRKVLDLHSTVATPLSSISSAPGFDAMATILAEMNNGETASLVNFESLLLFHSTKIFSIKSILAHRVLSTEPLTDGPPQLSVVPATITVNEKPPKSASSSQKSLFGSPNSSFSSDGGESSSSQPTVHTLCESLELRIIHKDIYQDNPTPTSSQSSEANSGSQQQQSAPSSIRLLFRPNDKKTSTLVLPSTPTAGAISESSVAPPASVKLFLRGFLKQEHVNPCWIAGESMVLVPAVDPSLEPRTSGPAGATSPRRKAQMRAKLNIASYAAFLSVLSSGDSCAILDIVAERFSSNVTAMLLPVTATTGIVIPIHESLHTVLGLLSRSTASNSSDNSSQTRRQHIPTRSTKSAGVLASTSSATSLLDQSSPLSPSAMAATGGHHLKLSLRSIYPPTFYHATKSSPLQQQDSTTLNFLEHGILEPQIDTTLLKKYNLLPISSHSQLPKPGALDHLQAALVASLGGGAASPTRKQPPGSPRRSSRLNPPSSLQAADELGDVSMDDSDDEEELPEPVVDTKNVYNDLISGKKLGLQIQSLNAIGASGHLTNLEAEMVKQLDYVTSDVHHYSLQVSTDELRASLKAGLVKPVSDLVSTGSSTNVIDHTRECRLQIAIRLETASSLKQTAVSTSDPPQAQEPSKGAKSGEKSRKSLIAHVELDKENREDVLRLLHSIRILMDADMEGGFLLYINDILINQWISKCPFTLKWLWGRLELERSLMPDALKKVSVASLASSTERKQQPRRRKPSAIVDDLDDVDTGAVSTSSRPKRKRIYLDRTESLPTPDIPGMPDLNDQDIFGSPEPAVERQGSPNAKKRKVNTSNDDYASSQEHPGSQGSNTAQSNVARATRSAALLSQVRAGAQAQRAPAAKLPTPFGDSGSSSSSSGGAASTASIASSVSSKNFAYLPFSAADIMNKLTSSNSGIPKPETQVRYLAKRPKSPPKSPPRSRRAASQNSPHKR